MPRTRDKLYNINCHAYQYVIHVLYVIIQEGKDKQFLLAKIYEITGEGPKPKSKPKPRLPPPTVKTVNEIPSEEDVSIYLQHLITL